MKFHATIGDRALVFPSDLAEQRFYEQKGEPVLIELDTSTSAEMQRYFEGGIKWFVFYQSAAAWENARDCREALKLQFGPTFWFKNIKGERQQAAVSMQNYTKERYRKFIDDIIRWMQENEMEVPDPEEFKRFRESGALKGEVYPPLARLKATWEKQKAIVEPWHRRMVQ